MKDNDQSKWWIWPAIVVGLMALQIGFSLTAVYFAVTDRSFAVEPSYYSRAMNWDSRSIDPFLDQDPGWTFNLFVGEKDASLGQCPITLDIIAASGKKIKGAEVTVVGFHHSNTKATQRIVMIPTQVGGYRGKLASVKDGIWEIQINARKGEKIYEDVQTVNLGKL